MSTSVTPTRSNRKVRIVQSILVYIVFLSGCTGTAAPHGPSAPALPPYNFAGFEASSAGDRVQAVRATITWSVQPITSDGSAQATWIGIFGQTDPVAHLSFRTAQIGWKQIGSGPPRLFWEWGIDRSHFTIHYGDVVGPSQSLAVEVARLGEHDYRFFADGAVVGETSLPWQASYLSAAAETRHPSDLMAGTAQSPETISDIGVEISGQWHHIAGPAFSTNSNYRASVDSTDRILIWDVRAREP